MQLPFPSPVRFIACISHKCTLPCRQPTGICPPFLPMAPMPCLIQCPFLGVCGAHPSCLAVHAMPFAMTILCIRRPTMASNGSLFQFKFQGYPSIRICTTDFGGPYMSYCNILVLKSCSSRTTLYLTCIRHYHIAY